MPPYRSPQLQYITPLRWIATFGEKKAGGAKYFFVGGGQNGRKPRIFAERGRCYFFSGGEKKAYIFLDFEKKCV